MCDLEKTERKTENSSDTNNKALSASIGIVCENDKDICLDHEINRFF